MGVLKWKVSNLINLLFPEYLVNKCFIILYCIVSGCVTFCIIIFHVNFLSSHWLRSVCQFSLSHGRGCSFSRSPSRFKTFMSESIAQFKRSDNQSRNLNWKIISVKEWKCSGNSWLFVWWLCFWAERVVEQIVTPRNSLSTEANYTECSFLLFSLFFMILMPRISIAVVFKCIKLWYRWLYYYISCKFPVFSLVKEHVPI
jgi:hypothetical protein